MADVELLPLPEHFAHQSEHVQEHVHAYARANLAPLQAENARLRAEVERLMGCLTTANANHEQFERQWYLERDRAERLAEALRDLLNDTQHKDHDCGDERWCPVIAARAALEQEAGRG